MKKLVIFFSTMIFVHSIGYAVASTDDFVYSSETLNFRLTQGGYIDATFHSLNGRYLKLQVVRGEKNDLQINPEAPMYSMDINISDKEGYAFVVQGKVLKTNKKKYLPNFLSNKTEEDFIKKRSQDFNELGHFADELQNETKTALLKTSLKKMDYIIDEIVRLMRNVNSKRNLSLNSVTEKTSNSKRFLNIVTIRKKKAFDLVYEHSAIISDTFRGRNLVHRLVTCNHGTCADHETMNYACRRFFYKRNLNHTLYVTDEMCDAYYPSSEYGLDHVCNDDTYVQFNSLKFNTNYANEYDCFYSHRLYAPNCN